MSSPLTSTFARMVGRPYADTAPDRDLIARFHQDRDEAAFAALVTKHGPMVLGVCRRKLRDPHAADDAYQATFLILAKKAGAVAWQESLGGWLYRVAEHVCRKALGRRARVALALPADVPAPPAPTPSSDLSAVLDEELLRLPASYRDPIVLCHLEGLTVDDAAKALGLSDGQLRGRLHRGREKLRDRLAARGVTLGVTALAVALTAGTAQAVPVAGTLALAGLAVGTLSGTWPVAVSANVLSLTRLGLSAMSRVKLHLLAVAAALAVTVVGLGFGVPGALADQPVPPVAAAPRPQPPLPGLPAAAPADDDDKKKDEDKIDRREGTIKSVDGAGGKLVLTLDEDKFDMPVELGPKAEVTVARRPVKLAELPAGMRATVSFRGTEKTAFQLEAHWPRLDTTVKGTDAAKNTLTIKTEGNNGFEFDATLPVAADARVEIDGLPAGLGDLAVGAKVHIEFAIDKKTVFGLEAEADKDDLSATVKAVDAANKTLTLTVLVAGHRDERKVDLAFGVTADAKVRFAGKDIALADLKPDMPVRAKFAADRRTIAALWAAPPKPKDDKDDD